MELFKISQEVANRRNLALPLSNKRVVAVQQK
jgi:hypothetical protein